MTTDLFAHDNYYSEQLLRHELPSIARLAGFTAQILRPHTASAGQFGPDLPPDMVDWLKDHVGVRGDVWQVYAGPIAAKAEDDQRRRTWGGMNDTRPESYMVRYGSASFKYDLFAFPNEADAFAFKFRWC